ncbi:hypothetical protein ACFQRB_12645 [Halobaculum litoreum]|uniref:Uncharacterized protein n=1 Tax=Halobaculum litoreum TaxID=3031998 RepID=A0ABD5XPS4_9EURY
MRGLQARRRGPHRAGVPAGRLDGASRPPPTRRVHHDDRGLLDRYADGPAGCYFNYPSEAILPGLRDQGWTEVGSVPTHYRVQDLERLAGDRLPTDRLGAKGALALGQAGLSLVRGVSSLATGSDADGWTVERHDAVPATTLVDLYRAGVPDEVHVRRDVPFYRWRFANPVGTRRRTSSGPRANRSRVWSRRRPRTTSGRCG